MTPSGAPAPRPLRTPTVAIIGAGVSGLCMAIRLRGIGVETFTIHEKGHAVGGTWRDNTYPGLYCDVPSRYFQYSFAPNPDWTRVFSPGPEIGRYLRDVADRHGITDRITFGSEITEGRWVDGRWRLSGPDGPVGDADFVFTGCGFLHRPSIPDLPGLDAFAGPTFHSSAWDHGVDLADARVGIVGMGSTAVQVVTALAGSTRSLTQFARTPQWILPLPNRRYTRLARWAYRRFPGLNDRAYRGHRWLFERVVVTALVHDGWQRRLVAAICRRRLRTIRDPDLRRRLTPTYAAGCKRLIVSTGYHRAIQHPDVAFVDDAIDRIEPRGVRTADGTLHELDVLVLATGFDTQALVRPTEFVGPDGRRLSDAWADGPRGYRTVAVPGLPNLLMAMGPNSPVNASSMVNVAETQVGYAIDLVQRWRRGEVDAVAPTEDAARRFTDDARSALTGTVWVTGCDSWYMGPDGTPQIWPWLPDRHRRMLAHVELEDFEELGERTDGRAAEPVGGRSPE
ncbi:MAG: NAD(P)/FAD-dependent oxidoreductase [Solirubrobacteraceae bacterium]|nr:NAD(P)/FAD-dependent oxidoreductase [Solirubrobacteraceae bacterium]